MTRHVWRNSDSLSKLAADHGLASWERIWDDPANEALRELRGSPENIREGDVLEIPDRRPGEVSRPTEVRHQFVRVGVPPASIRIITDGGNPRVAVATERRVLQVSTFATPDQLPTGFLTASTDQRNFKVEVFDEGANGEFINCELEAMKPLLDAFGRPQRGSDGRLTYEGFTPRRVIAGLRLRRVPGLQHIYRSQYLRLVTNEADDATQNRVNQTLLVDHDPNNLDIEILDQQVVARYTAVSGEPLAAEAVVGDGERRVRCKVFVCRTAFNAPPVNGGPSLVGGLTIDNVRRHMLTWVRRIYAQANMSPLLVDGEVIPVNPVENMIGISQHDRRNALGGREIRFRVNTAPNPTMIAIMTAAGDTPRQIADKLAAEARRLLPAGYTVEVFDNPLTFARTNSSDILIKNGENRVVLDRNQTLDPRIGILVGRFLPNAVTTAPFNLFNVGTVDNRAMIRNYRTGAEALGAVAVFVIGGFNTGGVLGFAYGRQFRERPEFQGTLPVAGSCFVAANAMSAANRAVAVTSHEMGHILIDMVHFNAPGTELMFPFHPLHANHVWTPRRISDRVLFYQEFVRGANRNFPINPNSEIRTREARFIENWDKLLRKP